MPARSKPRSRRAAGPTARPPHATRSLRFRLPNPPAVFVGRGPEVLHLQVAVSRAPATLVCGPGGVGKTALVLHALHAHLGPRVEQVVFVGLRPGAPRGQLLLEVLRGLTEADDAAGVDWAALSSEPETALAAAVDAAERRAAWVVLDDLHHGDADEAQRLLVAVARYARSSRWIGTTRHDPGVRDLVGQVVTLGPLADAALADLALQCAPAASPAVVRRAVATAQGLPWRLQQALLGAPADDERGAEADVLQGLEPGVGRFLQALSLLELPLPVAALARVVVPPSADVLAALARRGLVESTADGVRLHDVAQPLVRATLTTEARDALAARVAATLESVPGALAALEALRLYLDGDHAASALALLDARGDEVLAAGHAPRLARTLDGARAPGIAPWRLRCAVEVGNADVVAAGPPPDDAPPATRILWSRALLLADRLADAADAAAVARDDPRASARDAFDAGLLHAQCINGLTRSADAVAAVRALRAPDADRALLRDVYDARFTSSAGRASEALEAAEALARRAGASGRAVPQVVWDQIASVLIGGGRIAAAREVLARGDEGVGGGSAALYSSRRNLLFKLIVAVHGGHVAEARALVARLEPACARTPYLAAYLAEQVVALRIVAGDLRGLEDALAVLLAEARARRDGRVHRLGVIHGLRLAMLRAVPPPRPDDDAPRDDRRDLAALLALRVVEHALRTGGSGATSAAPRASDHPHDHAAQILARVIAARAALAGGERTAALVEVTAATTVARAQGHGGLEAEAREVECEVLLALDRGDDLARASEGLAALAAAAPSPRYAAEARFYATVARGGVPDPVALTELTSMDDVAPVAARRARALLGSTAPLDTFDALVLGSVRRRAGGARFELVAGRDEGDGPARGWTLDGSRQLVALPGGRRVELRRRPLLWRILDVIARHHGAATSEQLVLEAWGRHRYHPLDDAHRVRVAIHELRRMLEDDAAAPARLITTSDGYAFGAAAPVRWLVDS